MDAGRWGNQVSTPPPNPALGLETKPKLKKKDVLNINKTTAILFKSVTIW
jgi:hypothetical protein